MATKMMEVLEDAEPETQGHCFNHGGDCPYWDTDVQEVERKGGCVLVAVGSSCYDHSSMGQRK
eukprot:12931045-Prorocentrum_lima.AAC.1